MRYMGSKSRIAKHIIPLMMEKDCRFVDLMCGGCNLIDKVKGERHANDSCPYIFSLYTELLNGWEPPDSLTEEEYRDIRLNKDKYPRALVGFVGYGCSFGGKWFGGYARSSSGKRNHCAESKRNVLKQAQNLVGTTFSNLNYWEVDFKPGDIIYLDPPYRNTTPYKDKFDHDKMWEFARQKSLEGYKVYVSEYSSPSDFRSIWSKPILNEINKDTTKRISTENLFVYKGGK